MRREFLRRDALFLGINTDTHAPTYLPFAEMTSGTFVVGAAGSGKSNATHLLMQSILANLHLFQAVFCVDGKEGMTFARYRTAAPGKLRILTDEPDLWALTRELVAVTRARNATLARMGLDKAPNNFIARHHRRDVAPTPPSPPPTARARPTRRMRSSSPISHPSPAKAAVPV